MQDSIEDSAFEFLFTTSDIKEEQKEVKKDRTIFDIFKSLSQTKELYKNDKDLYLPVIMNKLFSKFPDSVFLSNRMNEFYSLPIEAQIDYYLLTVISRNRFHKWNKVSKNDDEVILYLMKNFNIQESSAIEYQKILEKLDINIIFNSGEFRKKRKKT